VVHAQGVYPTYPDSTVDTVQLWMVAFGILTTVIASIMRSSYVGDLPDLTKKLVVVLISILLAALGLGVQNHLFPEALVKSSLTILIVASGIYALLGKTIQDQVAGVKTIAVKKEDLSVVKSVAPTGAIVDPGH
jgi:hypothetical protein